MHLNLSHITAILGVLTLVNAAAVTYVVCQQFRLAKEKLKLDLFEKRFAVYKGVQIFLSDIQQASQVELKMVIAFRAATQVATFLFGEEIPAYLEEIDKQGLKAWRVNEEFRGMAVGPERNARVSEHSDLVGWLTSQLPELKKVFAPYLRFRAWG